MEKVLKVVMVVLLIAMVCALSYICVMSIMTPIKFDEQKELREKEVVKHLIDIRKVEVEFKNQKGHYTASADSLIDFIKNGRVPVVMKEGTLTDEQLNDGLTEAKAVAIVAKGNKKEIEAAGLVGFRRDTTYVSVYKTLFEAEMPIEEVENIFVIPFSENNQRFEINVARFTNASGIEMSLFEAKASYRSYLGDLNKQEVDNLIDTKNKLDKYPGLQVGDVNEPNNNAGNWE